MTKVLNKRRISILDIFLTIIIIILIALISGIFPYYMMGIGSDSMKPVISSGDAIILKKVNDKTNLKKGDIVAYNNGRIIIVHRIKKIDGTKYVMKGDANNSSDPRTVDRNQIKGVFQFKIPYIALPSVWLKNLLNN